MECVSPDNLGPPPSPLVRPESPPTAAEVESAIFDGDESVGECQSLVKFQFATRARGVKSSSKFLIGTGYCIGKIPPQCVIYIIIFWLAHPLFFGVKLRLRLS